MAEEAAPTLDAMHAHLEELAKIKLPDGGPAFLFRGERVQYPDCLTTADREYHKDSDVWEELDKLTAFVMSKVLPSGETSPKLRGAFARHHCLNTAIFDFTASPHVAINFAANRSWHKDKPRLGEVGILNKQTADNCCACELFDLRSFKDAPRAQKQEAYGLIYTDLDILDFQCLKRPHIANNIGLTWHRFAHLPDDESYLYVTCNDMDLMDIKNDPYALLAQDLIDEYIESRGPFSKKAAQSLSESVSPVNRSKSDNLLLWSGQK